MAHISKEVAYNLIVELGLPQVILDIFEGNSPEDCSYRYGRPDEYYRMTEEHQANYGADAVVPFMDNSNFDVLFAYDRQRHAYLRFYVESPTEGLAQPFCSWQQLMAQEFIRHYEDEMDNALLRDFAKRFDFHFVEELIELGERDCREDDERWLAECEKFVAWVGERGDKALP
ncbi:hypothetical protein HJC22_20370 [Corallococcus exiguus]|uniref:hypothetical protein n=1 Tax=Corallococcus TaxID=83461 RepID=UPI000F8758C3|nr:MULTISPECIES: hypothetical protein [Corallococcus]NNC18072.1 hypothetical protein [Corallococcus exiguus]RUO93102.1 hypothetical protein D7Y11_11515 [Corallococcus sp. AB018]